MLQHKAFRDSAPNARGRAALLRGSAETLMAAACVRATSGAGTDSLAEQIGRTTYTHRLPLRCVGLDLLRISLDLAYLVEGDL